MLWVSCRHVLEINQASAGVAVSAVTVAREGCDSTKLHWLPWRTGGDVPWRAGIQDAQHVVGR